MFASKKREGNICKCLNGKTRDKLFLFLPFQEEK